MTSLISHLFVVVFQELANPLTKRTLLVIR